MDNLFSSEAYINKNNPNVLKELSILESNLGENGLTIFRALCRDANTPISVETYEDFVKKEGEPYKFAESIRNGYKHIDTFLKERGL